MKPGITKRIEEIIQYYHNGNVNNFSKNIEISQQRINRLFNIDTRTNKYPATVPDDILKAILLKYSDVSERGLIVGDVYLFKDNKEYTLFSENEKMLLEFLKKENRELKEQLEKIINQNKSPEKIT